MSSVVRMPPAEATLAPLLVALTGLVAMYAPSYWTAAQGLWQTDDNGHAPIILAVVLWLFWQIRKEIQVIPDRPHYALGWSLLSLGIALHFVGRTFTIASAEFLSQPLVVAALLVLFKGPAALRIAWFPVVYLIFMVPMPGTLVDALTSPLKHWIAIIVVDALHTVGYPIARAGVIITIGQYQLLVADACSGLYSVISLSALGTLFMYLKARKSMLHNLVMLVAIVPIAFVANAVRVVVLVLVTYHLGDEAGQGFLHDVAGTLLPLVALSIFFSVDTTLRTALGTRESAIASR